MTKQEKIEVFLKVVELIHAGAIGRTVRDNPRGGRKIVDSHEKAARDYCKDHFGFTFPLEDDEPTDRNNINLEKIAPLIESYLAANRERSGE